MKVQYFTFILNPVSQPEIFTKKVDKVEAFKNILLANSPIKFQSHGTELALVRAYGEGDYAAFHLGKRETLEISGSPENQFEAEEVQNWPHIKVFFNFDNDPATGQRIAVEYRPTIFPQPHIQLEALAKELEVLLVPQGYVIEINAVTSKKRFWDTVEENKNKIKTLTLVFNSPNLLKLNSELNAELKNIEEVFGATKTTIQIENPEGHLRIPRDDELIKQGAEYITKGGGSYRLQIKNQRGFIKDKDNVEMENVVDIDLLTDDKEVIIQALDMIFKRE